MAERLTDEASAYLRQHAGNPVDWWPFGDAAFAEARRRDVPVFISVGYAACHWCHVMAHESFEDPQLAQYLNERFVPVKVDREERPDVDAVYMAATQAMTGQGGWPMSVFTLPDGRTFFAGTYYPPRQLQGMPSFRQVLEAVHSAWTERRGEVEASAAQLAAHLASGQEGNRRLLGVISPGGSTSGPDADVLPEAVLALAAQEDRQYGGFGGAPKFPPSTVLRFLQQHALSGADTAQDAAALAARTLRAMARGGIYDQLEGGFARYSVDSRWAVPHFEKMLYDNAQLLRLYAQWSRTAASGQDRALALRVTRETGRWLIKRLQVPGGAFASSLDADTLIDGHRVEGATYLWTGEQIQSVLAAAGFADAAAVPGLLDLEAGRMEGPEETGSTLHFGRTPDPAEEELWLAAQPLLLAARDLREQPERDDKVVAGWNGLAVAALADAALALGDAAADSAGVDARTNQEAAAELLAAAVGCAAYLRTTHMANGTLRRVSHSGSAQGIEGLLEDYAAVAEGFFALYAATGDEEWYLAAEELVLAAQNRFLVQGVLQDTAIRPNQLAAAQGVHAAADPLDGPTPSGTALFAGVLLTYSAYSGSATHRELAQALLEHVGLVAARAPRAGGWAMAVLQQALAGPQELAVVGTDPERIQALLQAGRGAAGPGLVTAVGDGGESRVPLLEGRPAAPDGSPLAYLCRAMVCRRPVGEPAGLEELLHSPVS